MIFQVLDTSVWVGFIIARATGAYTDWASLERTMWFVTHLLLMVFQAGFQHHFNYSFEGNLRRARWHLTADQFALMVQLIRLTFALDTLAGVLTTRDFVNNSSAMRTVIMVAVWFVWGLTCARAYNLIMAERLLVTCDQSVHKRQ